MRRFACITSRFRAVRRNLVLLALQRPDRCTGKQVLVACAEGPFLSRAATLCRQPRRYSLSSIARRTCFVHIGTHKTGTTSIQAFLAANRAPLQTLGLFVPAAGGNGEDEFACHHGVVRELLGNPRFAADAGCFERVAGELAATNAPVSCLTSEDFSLLHDRPEQLARLRDTIRAAGFEPKIVVYLRPQASYSIAIYAANVDSGFRVPFGAFLDDVIRRGRYFWNGGWGPPFDYARLLDAFAAVFGADNLLVRRFRSDAPDDALLVSFMAAILPGANGLAGLQTPPKRANRTLTFAGVLHRLGLENSFDEHVRFAPLTPAGLARVWLRFRGSNRELTLRYGVHLPVFEGADAIRTLPVRRTVALTRQLIAARAALNSLSSPGAPAPER
jgi:hypothetical protein